MGTYDVCTNLMRLQSSKCPSDLITFILTGNILTIKCLQGRHVLGGQFTKNVITYLDLWYEVLDAAEGDVVPF